MSPRNWLLVVLLVALLLAAAPAFAARPAKEDGNPGRWAFGRLRAGAAALTITPEWPVWLGGWGENRRSEGVHDNVWARALYLTDGRTELTLVALDLVGLMKLDQQVILDAVAAEVGPNVLINNSHTHSGPDVIGLWGPDETTPGWDANYIAYVQQRTITAILLAKQNARPACLYFGSAQTTPDDHIAVNWNDPATQDREVSVIRVAARVDEPGPLGATIATIFNFACHPEVAGGNHQDMSVWKYISSDYVHYARTEVEENGGGIAIFLQGALGAMVSPDETPAERNWVTAERIGRALGRRVLEAVAGSTLERNPRLSCVTRNMNIPLHNEYLYMAMNLGIVRSGPGRLAPNADSPLGVGVLTRVSAARIGDLQLATAPGEPYPRLGLHIKDSILTASHKMMLGLTHDELGYIMYADDYGTDNYAYETSMSVGPTIAEDIQAELQQAVSELE